MSITCTSLLLFVFAIGLQLYRNILLAHAAHSHEEDVANKAGKDRIDMSSVRTPKEMGLHTWIEFVSWNVSVFKYESQFTDMKQVMHEYHSFLNAFSVTNELFVFYRFIDSLALCIYIICCHRMNAITSFKKEIRQLKDLLLSAIMEQVSGLRSERVKAHS